MNKKKITAVLALTAALTLGTPAVAQAVPHPELTEEVYTGPTIWTSIWAFTDWLLPFRG